MLPHCHDRDHDGDGEDGDADICDDVCDDDDDDDNNGVRYEYYDKGPVMMVTILTPRISF